MEGNLKVYEKEGYLWASINPKIYDINVIYSAAYMFIETCYVMIDGDPEEEIIVELRPKDKKNLEELKKVGREFNNELVNYANYAAQCMKNANLREVMLKRVLLTNDPEFVTQNTKTPEAEDSKNNP